MKTKLFHIILLSFILFIYSCGSESNINSKSISSNSNVLKSDNDKKSDQSQINNSDKKSDQSVALVDFNPEDYDRKCMIDTVGPQKTFEIYQSNKIQANQISEISQCLMSDSDKKSDQSQINNSDKKSDQSQTDNNDKNFNDAEKCEGKDVDEGGLPLTPKCNVIPTPLLPGIKKANLLNIKLPNPNYQTPINKCQIFQDKKCAELK